MICSISRPSSGAARATQTAGLADFHSPADRSCRVPQLESGTERVIIVHHHHVRQPPRVHDVEQRCRQPRQLLNVHKLGTKLIQRFGKERFRPRLLHIQFRVQRSAISAMPYRRVHDFVHRHAALPPTAQTRPPASSMPPSREEIPGPVTAARVLVQKLGRNGDRPAGSPWRESITDMKNLQAQLRVLMLRSSAEATMPSRATLMRSPVPTRAALRYSVGRCHNPPPTLKNVRTMPPRRNSSLVRPP